MSFSETIPCARIEDILRELWCDILQQRWRGCHLWTFLHFFIIRSFKYDVTSTFILC